MTDTFTGSPKMEGWETVTSCGHNRMCYVSCVCSRGSSTPSTELGLLIEKLQRNADKVQKNIYDIEQNLNKVQSNNSVSSRDVLLGLTISHYTYYLNNWKLNKIDNTLPVPISTKTMSENCEEAMIFLV